MADWELSGPRGWSEEADREVEQGPRPKRDGNGDPRAPALPGWADGAPPACGHGGLREDGSAWGLPVAA